MAFLQTDFPPSTAPVEARPAAKARRPMPFARIKPRPLFSSTRVAAWGASLVAVALPGYATFAQTESLALGVLAADFVFLLAVAIWSTVSGR